MSKIIYDAIVVGMEPRKFNGCTDEQNRVKCFVLHLSLTLHNGKQMLLLDTTNSKEINQHNSAKGMWNKKINIYIKNKLLIN